MTFVSATNFIAHFNDTVNATDGANASLYQVRKDSDLSAVAITSVELASDSNSARVITATALEINVDYRIGLKTTFKDDAGNPLSALSEYTFTAADSIPPAIASVTAIDGSVVRVAYSEAVDARATNIANYTLSPSATVTAITDVMGDYTTYDLVLADLSEDEVTYALIVSNVYDRATPTSNKMTEGSTNFLSIDSTPPTLVSVAATSDTTLLLSFSEAMASNALVTPGNYSLSPSVTVQSVAYEAAGSNALVTLASALMPGVSYTLTLANLTDDSVSPSTSNTIVSGTTTNVTYDTAPTITNLVFDLNYYNGPNRGTRFTYEITDDEMDTMVVRFAYAETNIGQALDWIAIEPSSIHDEDDAVLFATDSLTNGTYANVWRMPTNITVGGTYYLRVSVTATNNPSETNSVVGEVVTTIKIFHPKGDIAEAKVLNNPYYGQPEGVVLASLPSTGSVTINVYTASGVRIATIPYTPDASGMVSWIPEVNGKPLSMGVYIILINDGTIMTRRKVVILGE